VKNDQTRSTEQAKKNNQESLFAADKKPVQQGERRSAVGY